MPGCTANIPFFRGVGVKQQKLFETSSAHAAQRGAILLIDHFFEQKYTFVTQEWVYLTIVSSLKLYIAWIYLNY